MNKYLLIGALVAGAASGYWLRGLIAGADIADIQTTHAQQLRFISAAALAEQQRLQNEYDERARLFAEFETKHYQELRNAESEIDRLRDDVAAGNKRLLIRASCPASAGDLSETDSGASLDIRVTAELDRDARQDYYNLRSGIERITKQLLACQDRLR